MITPRNRVFKSLNFERPDRIPRDLWIVPYFENKFKKIITRIEKEYPSDFAWLTGNTIFLKYPTIYQKSSQIKGSPYKKGIYHDKWGCKFKIHANGMSGILIEPQIKNLSDTETYTPPYEILPNNYNYQKAKDIVNNYCKNSDKFIFGSCCPHPWERVQSLLGTENAFIGLLTDEDNFKKLLDKVHSYYLKEFEFWASTNVDGLIFMDDWGAQNSLLISPILWRKIFKPLYREYCELAKISKKYVFMHSDGNIEDIYSDIIEIGVHAINSQLSCMNLEEIAKKAKGKITFWGEIDRQNVLTSGNELIARNEVKKISNALYMAEGGIIAQLELGIGANPNLALPIYNEWGNVAALF